MEFCIIPSFHCLKAGLDVGAHMVSKAITGNQFCDEQKLMFTEFTW